MKTKKWITIGLISLVVLITSVVLLFVLVLPGIKRNKAMKALEEGEKAEASTLFMEMDPDKVDGFKDDVKDLVVYKANQCIKSEIDYEDFFEVMDAVENVSNFRGMTQGAFIAVNGPRMKKLYLDGVNEYTKSGDSKDYSKIRDEFRKLSGTEWKGGVGIRFTWDDSTSKAYETAVIDPLEAELKTQYDAYNAGTLDYDTMNAYAETAESFWYSDAAFNIRSEMYYDKIFRESLDEAKASYDKEEYWECIRSIDSTRSWYGEESAYKKWKSQFDTLYEEAENRAKTYYVEKAIEAAKNNDKYEVESTIAKLKEHFGEDFDTSKIEENLHAEWQTAYVTYFAGNWKNDIKSEIDSISDGDDFFGLKTMDLEKDLPSKIFLKDLDNDKIPEVLLADSKYMFVFGYYGGTVRCAGVVQWRGIGDDGKIVAGGEMVYEGININVMLVVEYKKGTLNFLKMAATGTAEGQVIYGVSDNGTALNQVDEEAYKAAVEAINAEVKTTALSGGANLADYEQYIYSWKAE